MLTLWLKPALLIRARATPRLHRICGEGFRPFSSLRTDSFRGVKRHGDGTYQVRIQSKGEAHTIGPFTDAKIAAVEYDKLALKLHGSKAKLNFPEEDGEVACVGESPTLPPPIDTDGAIVRLESTLSPFWIDKLKNLDRATAVGLITQLSPLNALAYDLGTTKGLTEDQSTPRAGTLLSFIMEEKAKHRDKVVLVRVGDFYESYGIDAVMLVEFAGLNPMGGRPRAGCPWKNLQATLDGLVGSGGLTVAVYEELNDHSPGSKRKGLKSRALTQIVSPGSATYLYDLSLRSDSVEYREARPFAAVSNSASGWSLATVNIDSHEYRVFERLTDEALRSKLVSLSPVEPLFVSAGLRLPFSYSTATLPGTLASASITPDDLSSKLLHEIGQIHAMDVQSFRSVEVSQRESIAPLFMSTAAQIGLLDSPYVFPLTHSLLPQNAHSTTHALVRQWLLNPPPATVADARQAFLRELCELAETPIPLSKSLLPKGKLVAMLEASQGNAPLFRELGETLSSVWAMLGMRPPPPHLRVWQSNDHLPCRELEDHWLAEQEQEHSSYSGLVEHMVSLTAFESGLRIPLPTLTSHLKSLLHTLGTRIASPVPFERRDSMGDITSVFQLDSCPAHLPVEFFRRNEHWRGNVNPHSDAALLESYEDVLEKSRRLVDAVSEDFENRVISHDPINNFLFTKVPDKEQGQANSFTHPRDRHGKVMSQRHTTLRVVKALEEYQEACSVAESRVKAAMRQLSKEMMQSVHTLVYVAHWAAISQALYFHSIEAHRLQWTLPALVQESSGVLEVKELLPYWMGRTSGGVPNSFDLSGKLMLLTAPNMSGKSTLMRSLLVAALLANSGLYTPTSKMTCSRFDAFFLRTVGHDIPVEGKSAWALEADEVRALLRDSTSQSLVMVDELGRGTSSRDGAAVAGALLEVLDEKELIGIFSTHLHELFQLPLKLSDRVARQRMGVQWISAGDKGGGEARPTWTYQLEDGMCTDSLALHTARAYGLCEKMLSRAQELAESFDQHTRNSQVQNGTVIHEEKKILFDLQPDEKLVHIPPGFAPPTSIALSQACVYIFQLPSSSSEPSYYVGETDNLEKRVNQHRSKGGLWREADVFAFKCGNKSSARAREAELIRSLAATGKFLISTHDASHRHFSR